MPLSDEQIKELHEQFGEKLRDNSYSQDRFDEMATSIRKRYDKAIDLAISILNYGRFNFYDYDSDGPRCPHCGEDLL